jgi:hypothetical protein
MDSWEANMTYQGITFMVTAQREDWRDTSMWEMEVLRQTSRWSVQTLYGAYDPTVEAVSSTVHTTPSTPASRIAPLLRKKATRERSTLRMEQDSSMHEQVTSARRNDEAGACETLVDDA